ncbi:MAG: hypothetical protein J7599_17190 [Niabella sp.]|nr:hypothetical protein [Niabella sp.]
MEYTNILMIVGAAALAVLLYTVVRDAIRGQEGLSAWQLILLVVSVIGIVYPVCKQVFE